MKAETTSLEWPVVLSLLPAGWEQAAETQQALQRRREIGSAQALLRLVMAYALNGLGLRGVASWAEQMGVAGISHVDLRSRIRNCQRWLAWMVQRKLAERVAPPDWLKDGAAETAETAEAVQTQSGRRVVLVDGTFVQELGSKGTDWRGHLAYDPRCWEIVEVHLTDAKGAEKLRRFTFRPADIAVADRLYANRADVCWVYQQHADVLVRMNWSNLPLQTPDAEAFDVVEHLRGLPQGAGTVGEWQVRTVADRKAGLPAVCGRVVAVRLEEKVAEKARRRAREQARKKGHTPDARTLESCGFLFVFTTLAPPDFPAELVLQLYRFRWQVELVFKGLKSILLFGKVAAKDGALCCSVLLCRVLVALLMQETRRRSGAFSPSGVGAGQTAGLPGEAALPVAAAASTG